MRADAAVVGAGPAGCAAAIGLARSGARVTLYRRGAVPGCRPGEIIEPTFRTALAALGLDDPFTDENALALAGNVSVWDDDDAVVLEGMTNPHGLGALIDRAGFEDWLLSEARRSGVTIAQGDGRLAVVAVGGGWRIARDASPEVLATPLLIQATGRGNGLVGPRARMLVDRLVALLWYGDRPPGPADQRLLIEAGEHGWWYAAPLPGDRAVVALMTDADLLPSTAEGRTRHFHAQLGATRLIAPFAAGLSATTPILGFPAQSGIRNVIYGDGWVSVGDAAATYDPLSGRGVPVALAKGAAIARLVAGGGGSALAAYADSERSAFADFRARRDQTYRRAATRFASEFWRRRR